MEIYRQSLARAFKKMEIYQLRMTGALKKVTSWAGLRLKQNGDLQAELGSGLKKWRFGGWAWLGFEKNRDLQTQRASGLGEVNI